MIAAARRKRDSASLESVRDLVQRALDLIEGTDGAQNAELKLRALLAMIDDELEQVAD